MRIEPYLMLAGRCEEAITFYGQALGARMEMLMRFDESPDKNHPMPLPPNWGQKVMHCSMQIGDTLVMASDGMSAEPVSFAGISLSITADNEAQAKQYFDALANGGKVMMPLSKTFWSPCFGMLSDKFGVSWMIGVDG
jgi:PhnB protein